MGEEQRQCQAEVFQYLRFKPSQIGGDGGSFSALHCSSMKTASFKPSQIGGDGGSSSTSRRPVLLIILWVSSPPKSEGMGEAVFWPFWPFCSVLRFKPSQIGGDGGSCPRDTDKRRVSYFVSSPPKSEGMGEESRKKIYGRRPELRFKPSQIGGDGGRNFEESDKLVLLLAFQALPNRRGWGKPFPLAERCGENPMFQALPNRRGWGKSEFTPEVALRLRGFQALPNRRGWGKGPGTGCYFLL